MSGIETTYICGECGIGNYNELIYPKKGVCDCFVRKCKACGHEHNEGTVRQPVAKRDTGVDNLALPSVRYF